MSATCYLQIENLTKSYGDHMIFADVAFGINEGDKIGIVAKNGTGKTTLLRCLAGLESPDSGTVTPRSGLRIGMLEQTPRFDDSLTVVETCLADSLTVAEAIAAYETALAADNPDALHAAMEQMEAAGAWDYEDRLKRMLSQLGITDPTARVGTLSGGQKKRVALARVMLEAPDLIILDEPTNHLDIDSIEWIENFLTHQRVTLLMVTHDRYFLDRICNHIIEIDNARIYSYDGNYDYYLRRRQERIEAMTAELAKLKNTLRREQEWMSRQPQARAGKAKYRIDNFYDLKNRAADINLRDNRVDLNVNSAYIGSKIFEARNISKRFADKVILSDFSYTFARYEKVGIIGRNGVGKSTFIKMLQGLVPQDSGTWDVGTTVRFGYYSQEGIKFDDRKRVIDAVSEIADDIVLEEGMRRLSASQFLANFLFTPADQQKYIATLSGGEKARLHLATVLMRQPNFLILDEPTNDLDIVTLGILEEYLANFKGCAIIISHDRFFLDSIVDHLFVFEGNGKVLDFPGTYTEYRQYLLERQAREEKQRKEAAPKPAPKPAAARPAKMTFKERREFEALEAEIAELTAEKQALEAEFNSGGEIADIAAKSERFTQLTAMLNEKEMRWLELSEKDN